MSTYQIFRPFLWVAAMSFVVGFAGFLMLGRGAFADDEPPFEKQLTMPAAYDAFAQPNPMRAV